MSQRTNQDVLDPCGVQVISALTNSTPQGLTLPTEASGPSGTLTTVQVRRAKISVETQAIRYYEDGSTPSTTDGHPVAAGQTFYVDGLKALINFLAIGQASSAKLTITYYR